MAEGTHQDPQVLDKSELDLTELRRHVRAHHKPRSGETVPRSNLHLAGWHANKHYRLWQRHRHLGLMTLVQWHSRKPVGVTPVPEGNFTGKDMVTREEDAAAWRARHPARD